MNLPTVSITKTPPLTDKYPKEKLTRKLTMTKSIQVKTNKILPSFTVIWSDTFGVPFLTSGFFVVAFNRFGRRIATANFDNYGVAKFTGIPTRTQIRLTLRAFNRNGLLFRTRFAPAGLEAFVIIG